MLEGQPHVLGDGWYHLRVRQRLWRDCPPASPRSSNPSQLLNPETQMSSLTPPFLPSSPHEILHQILPVSQGKFSQIRPLAPWPPVCPCLVLVTPGQE